MEAKPTVAAISEDYWRVQGLVPEPGGTLASFCAPSHPDPQALCELAVLLGSGMQVDTCSADEFEAAVARTSSSLEPGAAELIASLGHTSVQASLDDLPEHDLMQAANQAPVVRLVNLLLSEAVEVGASDVHLELEGTGIRVRYRVDGVLQEAPSPPPHLKAAVVSRLKIMAELDIAERRMPQDGRIRLHHADREVDVRVSTLPTLHGESVVLRLLTERGHRLSLDDLGLSTEILHRLTQSAQLPQGVLLATGPTGSGKTTTLYALLTRLLTGTEKAVALEDPVEFDLDGVTQVPIRTGAFGFASGLRSVLRQDPDVLLVGEMRDAETAEVCTQAALTGHLVLSTLHTNDAPSALVRLIDLGVPGYLVASTVTVVLAQRLVRCLCPHCSAVREPSPAERDELLTLGYEASALPEAHGCPECRESGYRGRTGLYELLSVGDEIREALARRPSAPTLRALAMELGMVSLRQDGWDKVLAGRTSPEELQRVTVR